MYKSTQVLIKPICVMVRPNLMLNNQHYDVMLNDAHDEFLGPNVYLSYYLVVVGFDASLH